MKKRIITFHESSRGHTLFRRHKSALRRIEYFSTQTTVEAAELVRKWCFSPGFKIQIMNIKVSVPGWGALPSGT
jgi:hypothetical protein